MTYTYESTKLTDNNTNDYNPHVARNGDISWQSVAGEDNTNVWYYGESGKEEVPIGNAEYNEGNSYISYTQEETSPEQPPTETSYVVYEAEVTPENTDIYYWNSEGVSTPIADKPYNEYKPEVHNNYVVYEAEVTPENRDIYLYDVETETEVEIDIEEYDAYNPHISGEYVIYEAEVAPGDTNLYSYNITEKEVTPIAETPQGEGKAQVWGNGDVVYQYQTAENNYDIYYYDALTGESTPLTTAPSNQVNPDIAGNYISWQGWDGNDWEIYRYDITTGATEQLTDNTVDDYAADVSTEGHVVYQQNVSQYNVDVYAYTDTGTLALGTNPGGDVNPEIYGSYVTWQSWDGNDFEVYSAEISFEA